MGDFGETVTIGQAGSASKREAGPGVGEGAEEEGEGGAVRD